MQESAGASELAATVRMGAPALHLSQIAGLKATLEATDYKQFKGLDGEYTDEEYELYTVIRAQLRQQIRDLDLNS